MAALKSAVQSPGPGVSWFDCAIFALAKVAEFETDADKLASCQVLLEQLHLLQRKQGGRRFSQSLLIASYCVYSAGPAAYRALLNQGLLLLPSEKRLAKITGKVDADPTEVSSRYLEKRFSKVRVHEAIVSLLWDEIYVAQRIEYCKSQGTVVGLTENSEVAKTVLCFMISSVSGTFRDVVKMYPVKP